MVISSSPSNPCTTSTRSNPSILRASASFSTNAAEYTPTTWAEAWAGFVSGPSKLKTVRRRSSRRAACTCCIAECIAGANRNAMPTSLRQAARRAGGKLMRTPSASMTSAEPHFEVMEALGVRINLPPARLAACLKEVGIAFLFAPAIHSAMQHVQAARRELRLRTVFNLLGPLTNPAHASAQVVGVYSAALVEKLAEALSMLGLHRALVVHGLDGLDEITITGPTRIAEVRSGTLRTYEVTPEEFGMQRGTLEDISGGDAGANAAIIAEVLEGKKSSRRDVVLLNAAAALVAAGKADHLADALPLASNSIDSGAAAQKLEGLVEFTNVAD